LPYQETVVPAEPQTETQPAIVKAVLRAPVAEQQRLLAWSREIGVIRLGDLKGRAKAAAVLALTRERKAAWPLAKVVGRAFWIILWEARSWALRLGVLALIATFTVIGNAAAGIVPLGGGLGLPLWVLTGGSGALAGLIADQVVKRRRRSTAGLG
jgi:hypothetical protein